MGKLKSIFNRIYSDYLMPSRLDEYEKIIQTLVEKGYEVVSFRQYCLKYENNELADKKYFINRHDIDTDVSTAKEFFKIEKKYNVNASYYFRQTTLDYDFMQEIESYGSEASYHFEEIAQYCKDNHIKSREEAIAKLDEIKAVFEKNFLEIERKLGVKIYTVCSHGDFVNRALKIVNNEITKDKELRERLGIGFETYDEPVKKTFDFYLSDKLYPIFYSPKNIFDVIDEEYQVICMLSHPRHWRTNFIVNTVDNLKRIYEGLKWK